FRDRYEEALLELVRAKKAGKKAPKAKAEPKPSNVVNLFDALKKSLSSEGGSSTKTGKSSKAAAPARRGRKASASKRKSA
ncbi:Ku protein, partial [Mesorhizobium sp. M1D.F.Ca.ET.183.01.1.1]